MNRVVERCPYPFPLAVNSSHHSHYHRFLLGVDPGVIAPFPKPYCAGALSTQLGRLTAQLDLPRWRKLYHASFPWTAGFGPEHYEVGNVPPHRPLPLEYGRPERKFGAFDFVQVADPSVSALALVAGDRRVLERFLALGDQFCARVEEGACSRNPGGSGARLTGRMLAGQFAEPNNRWLMPFLHVHTRVLNFTSFAEAPERLTCIDSSALATSGRSARSGWISSQAQALADLGYSVEVGRGATPSIQVEGVRGSLLAAIEAPRLAVLRLLERLIIGNRPSSAGQLGSELPPAVIAAMAEQLETVLVRSMSFHKPAKMAIPSEGPWRRAVREHVGHCCPESLVALDAAAARAKAAVFDSAIFPTPPLDAAHCHAPCAESYEARSQLPDEPELAMREPTVPGRNASSWLVREFHSVLGEVNERVLEGDPGRRLAPFQGMLATIDQISEGADPRQLRQSELLLGVELDRRTRQAAEEAERRGRFHHGDRGTLISLDELFEDARRPRLARELEIGGRSL